MPVRHWPTLPETQIISDMLKEAPSRVEKMIANAEGFTHSAKDFMPENANIKELKEAAKIQSGSKEPNRSKVGKVTWAQVEEIAKDKMADLNAFTLESAASMVAGTARSMGLTVEVGPAK